MFYFILTKFCFSLYTLFYSYPSSVYHLKKECIEFLFFILSSIHINFIQWIFYISNSKKDEHESYRDVYKLVLFRLEDYSETEIKTRKDIFMNVNYLNSYKKLNKLSILYFISILIITELDVGFIFYFILLCPFWLIFKDYRTFLYIIVSYMIASIENINIDIKFYILCISTYTYLCASILLGEKINLYVLNKHQTNLYFCGKKDANDYIKNIFGIVIMILSTIINCSMFVHMYKTIKTSDY